LPIPISEGTFIYPQFADDLRKVELGDRFPELACVQCLKIPHHTKDPAERWRRSEAIKKNFTGLSTAEGNGQKTKNFKS